MPNLFATTDGVRAQHNAFRLLAAADAGAVADFAKDVVTGRRHRATC